MCAGTLGPLRSRAAKAIGFIDMMIDYSIANAPLQKELLAGMQIMPMPCNPNKLETFVDIYASMEMF